MEYKVIAFCSACIEDVIEGEIDFVSPVIISEVSQCECDNVDVDHWSEKVWNNPNRVVNLD